jgi:WD40 repeat protein/serine/threonine protein kinase
MVTDNSEQFVLLNHLADEFADRYRRGERPSLQEYIDRHPELAQDIREFFPAMVEMEQAKEDRSAVSEPVAAGPLPPLERLGDFRIIREIGHGGMGVVYEAEQISLGRHIALKVLPKQLLADARTKRRFEREAKAAAKLHHTNIVPVFGVGEHDGLPYYVMQFIPGLGLDEVLEELKRLQTGKPGSGSAPGLAGGELLVSRKDVSAAAVARSLMTGGFAPPAEKADDAAPAAQIDVTVDHASSSPPAFPAGKRGEEAAETRGSLAATPVAGRLSDTFSLSSSSVQLPGTGRQPGKKRLTYWQSVAQIGVQVADALEYAHRQGIQHRDIKPSNLLLDTTGTVWVTDFGLAKADDQQDLTQTGDVLGTLRYMPPEAFDGKTDARGDVYSLGITLYELLAFRPAFEEKERKRLIKQVTMQEPARLDRLNPAAPRDLVTIVHKAIEREPAHRYPTAGELQADLKRFLDDEPIKARRQTQLERYVRWARHNPGIAVLGAVLTAVLILVTVASLLAAGYFNRLRLHEARAAQNERAARRAETEQRQRAETSEAEALAALEEADHQREIARQQREVATQNLYYAQMHLGQQAWREHRGIPRMRELLAHWLPKDESPDRRGWEWFYINSLPYQNVRTFTESGRNGRPSTVAWHSTSNRVAEGTSDGLIRIWDVDRQQTILTLSGPPPVGPFWGVRWLAWSPDGSKLAAGFNDTTVHVWETASGKELTVFRQHKSPVISVAFSSDGKRLAACGQDGSIKIWDLDTGRLTEEVIHPGNVSACAWSPDDKLIAAGHFNGTVTVSGAKAGAKVVTLRGHVDIVYHLAWSPDSARLLSTGGDFTALVWDVASEKTDLPPLRHSHGITSAAWEPSGQRLATGSFDQTIKIWDATTGRETLTLRGHVETVTSLAWGPGGRLASASNDGSLKIWGVVRDQEWSALPAHGVRTTSVSWSPDGKRLASAGDDGIIRIWDPATREEVVAPLKGHDERRVIPQFGLIRSLAWSPDGTHLASAGLDGAVKIWDVAGSREVFALPADHGSVWSVAWSPDGSQLAVGSDDGSIRVVAELKETPKVQVFKAHQGRARGLAWSPQGDRLASVGLDGLVKVWDPVRSVEVAKMQGHQGGVFTVAWSPDGKRVVSAGNDHFVIAWDATTGQKISTMRGHNDWVDAVVWSPDGSRLASAGLDNSIRIWDPSTGEETFVLRGTSGMFHDVSWSPDGAQLAAASSDGQIWIWDATPGFEHDTTPRSRPFIERKIAAGLTNNAERLQFAQLAYDHRLFGVAARLWAEALSSDPKLGDDRQSQHRFKAARAACMAVSGAGDEPALDDAAKAKLRTQALDWLKAELNAWGQLLESGPVQDREVVLLQLNGWKHDSELAGIRDTAALAKLPADEQKTFTTFWADAAALLKTAYGKQEALLQQKLPAARKTLPKDSPELAYLLAQIGRAMLEQERWAEAEPVLRECLAIREKALPDSWLRFNALSSLGGSLLGQRECDEAEPLLLKGYQGMKEREETIPPVGRDRLPEAAERLVQLYEATGKEDEAAKWRRELQKLGQATKPERKP